LAISYAILFKILMMYYSIAETSKPTVHFYILYYLCKS